MADQLPAEDIFTTTIIPIAPTPQAHQVIYTNVILVVLTLVWTVMRFYSRHVRKAPWAVEDFLYLGSLVFFYGFVAAHFLMQLLGGAGHDIWRLQPFHIQRLMIFGFASQVLYAISLGMLKISICWMLQRIFFVKKFKIAAWATMAFAAAWMTQTMLIGFFICQPIQMNWSAVPGGRCGDQTAAFASVGIVDIVIDLVIFILPLPMVFKLQISKAHRIALSCIFGAGILTIVFASLRLHSVYLVDFQNFSKTSPVAMIWASAEIGVALMISSSPILRPVFDRMFSRWISSIRSTGHKSGPRLGYYGHGQSSGNPQSQHAINKKPAVGPDGFLAMNDSDEDFGLQGASMVQGRLPGQGMALTEIRAGGGKRSSSHGSRASDTDPRNSTDKIFVQTEIVQKST